MPRPFVCALILLFACAAAGMPTGQTQAQTFVDRQTPDAVRIVSYNVYFDQLFQGPYFPGELERFIQAVDADVWNFQEAFSTTAEELRVLFNNLAPLPGGTSWNTHKGRNQIIVSRYPLSLLLTDVPGGTRGIAMALVDLPDEVFSNDLYILNNHFPCCDDGEEQRQFEAERIIDWIEDAQTPGGTIDLEFGTGILVLGDLNIVSGPTALNTLLNGYDGFAPDWDDTSITDAHPLHNYSGPADWTWRNDQTQYDPGILDFILYTDSVINAEYGYVLNPSEMTSGELQQTGLIDTDFMLDKDNPVLNIFDHLPLIVDFVPVIETVSAQQFNIIRGIQIGGTIADIADSDDSYLEFNPGLTLNSTEPPVWIEFESVIANQQPDSLTFTLESRTNTVGLNRAIDLFNFDSNAYETVSSASATLTDTTIEIPANGDVGRFVQTGTGVVKCRVGWKAQGPISVFPWTISIDLVSWTSGN